MFGLVDVDDSGEITAREFAAALKKLGQEMTVDDVMEVAKDVDNDESGDLAIEERKFECHDFLLLGEAIGNEVDIAALVEIGRAKGGLCPLGSKACGGKIMPGRHELG